MKVFDLSINEINKLSIVSAINKTCKTVPLPVKVALAALGLFGCTYAAMLYTPIIFKMVLTLEIAGSAVFICMKLLCRPTKEEITNTEIQKVETFVKDKRFFAHFDRQLIVNLGSGATAKALTTFANDQEMETSTINVESDEVDLTSFSTLTSSSCLYVVGHCFKGCSRISSDKKAKVSVTDLVEQLKKVSGLKENQSKKLTISLVACNSALRQGKSLSFAEQLSQALDAAGIPAIVYAHAENIARSYKGEDAQKVVNRIYGKSAMVFEIINGKTTIYNYKTL